MSLRSFVIGGIALVVVTIAACLYNRVLLSDLPKNVDASVSSHVEADDSEQNLDVLASKAPELLELFPDPNDWRRDVPNVVVLNDRQFFILSKRGPKVSPDNKTLMINSCTFVFLDPDETKPTKQRAFIFDCAERIDLTFAEPLSALTSGMSGGEMNFDFSKFIEGQIRGEVELISQIGESEVRLRTREVVFNDTQIHTNYDVDFQIGPNFGSGAGLTIDMESPFRLGARPKKTAIADPAAASPDALIDNIAAEGNVGGGFSLKSIQLRELKGCLKIYGKSIAETFADRKNKKTSSDDSERAVDIQPGDVQTAAASDDPSESESKSDESDWDSYYVEVRCKGDLQFSSNANVPGGWCVRFNKNVEFVAFQDGAKSKQIQCGKLYLYFQDPLLQELADKDDKLQETIARKRITGSLEKLEPTIVRALCDDDSQVNARDFDSGSTLEANEIRYDLKERLLDLLPIEEDAGRLELDRKPVRIRLVDRGKSEFDFSAVSIQVQMNDDNDVEAILARENGSLEGAIGNASGQVRKFSAKWASALRAVPDSTHEGFLHVSSSGAVSFQAETLGSFYANEGDFWCKLGEDPNVKREPGKNLAFSAKQLDDMKPVVANFHGAVTFRSDRGEADIKDSVVLRFETRMESAEPEEEAQTQDVFGALASGSDEGPLEGDAREGEPKSRFVIAGYYLDVGCLLRYYPGSSSPKAEITHMILNKDVVLEERAGAEGKERMRLQAERVTLKAPNSEETQLTLEGTADEPALFKTEKLSLVGSNIVVDKAANSFKVLGPGMLELAASIEEAAAMKKNASNTNAPNTFASATNDARSEPREDVGTADNLRNLVSDEPVKIAWTNALEFNGSRLCFTSGADKYVVVQQGTQRVLSPEVALTLKNPASIFELDVKDKKGMEPKLIECIGDAKRPVDIQIRAKKDANDSDDREAVYSAIVTSIRYDMETGVFTAAGGGLFDASIPSDGDSFNTVADSLGRGAANSAPNASKTKSTPPRLAWTRFQARFDGEIVGDANTQEAKVRSGLHAVAASVEDRNAKMNVDDPASCPEGTVSIESQEAYMKLLKPDPKTKNGKQQMELVASKDVKFRQNDVFGACDSLRYSSAKNTLILSGTPTNKGAAYRQAYRGAERETLGEFLRATYQIDSRQLSVEALSHGN